MSVEYKDFSGGFTDNITNGNRTQYEKAENLLVTRDKKLETRPGSEVLSVAASYESVVRAVSERVGNIVNYRSDRYALIRKSADVFFQRVGNSVWQKVVSPNATQKSFWTGAADGVVQFKEAFGHIYGVMHNNPSGPAAADILRPMKFYADNGATELVQIRNTYLPAFPDPYAAASWLATAITLGNQLKSKMNTHFRTGATGTMDATTDRVTITGSGSYLSDSDTYDQNLVWFKVSPTPEVVTETPYYLKSQSGSTFQLSTTPVGSAINFSVTGACELWFHASAQTAISTADASDLETLITLTNALVEAYNAHVFNMVGSGTHATAGHTGTFYATRRNNYSFSDCAETLNQLKLLFNAHLLSVPISPLVYDAFIRIHSGVLSSDFVTADFVFNPSDLSPDTGGVNLERGYYAPQSDLYAYNIALIIAYNAHVSNTTKHNNVKEDYGMRIKNTSYTGFYESVYLVTVYQLLVGMYGHRSDGTSHIGGSEAVGTQPSTENLQILEDMDAYTINGNLTDSAGQQVYFDMMTDIAKKLAIHIVSATRHNSATTPTDLGLNTPPLIYVYTLFTFLYAFTYFYRYLIKNSIEFDEESAPAQISLMGSNADAGSFNDTTGVFAISTPNPFEFRPNVIFTNLPGLSSVVGENVDAANARTRIYRSVKNGTALFQAQDIPANSTSAIDTGVTDEELVGYQPLYTTGGVVANDPAPRAKAFTIVNNKGYYGGIIETTSYGDTFLPKRLRQSNDSAPGECPEDFFVDLEEDIQTIGRAGDYPVVACSKGCYRIEGEFDELGRGGMIAKLFADRVGGVSINGGVTINDVFYFAGIDGIYASNAFDAKLITPHLKTTYSKYVTGTRKHYIQADFDKTNNRIFWTVRKATGGTESDLETCLVLDLRNGTVDEACLTEFNGTSFSSTAIAFISNQFVRGDKQGFAFKHVETDYSDPGISRSGSGSISGTEAVIPLWRSMAEGFDQSTERKWEVWAYYTFKRLTTNLSVQFRSIIDQTETKIKNMKHLLHRSTSYSSGYAGSDMVSAKRTIPAGHMRSYYRQLEVALGKGATSSSTSNFAAVTGTSVVLASGTFAADANGKYMAFSGDFYNEEYLIVSGQGTNILVLATAPGDSTSQGWAIREYPKDERMRIDAVSMDTLDAGRTLRPSVADGTTA